MSDFVKNIDQIANMCVKSESYAYKLFESQTHILTIVNEIITIFFNLPRPSRNQNQAISRAAVHEPNFSYCSLPYRIQLPPNFLKENSERSVRSLLLHPPPMAPKVDRLVSITHLLLAFAMYPKLVRKMIFAEIPSYMLPYLTIREYEGRNRVVTAVLAFFTQFLKTGSKDAVRYLMLSVHDFIPQYLEPILKDDKSTKLEKLFVMNIFTILTSVKDFENICKSRQHVNDSANRILVEIIRQYNFLCHDSSIEAP